MQCHQNLKQFLVFGCSLTHTYIEFAGVRGRDHRRGGALRLLRPLHPARARRQAGEGRPPLARGHDLQRTREEDFTYDVHIGGTEI